jgi:transposase InsO family protein
MPEVEAVMNQVLDHPWMGGKKGAANLVHARVTWVGPESYDTIKRTMMQAAGEELARRRPTRQTPAFDMPRPTKINEVWSSDLAEIKAWGKHYDIGTFMDVHSQEHIVLEATEHAADAAFVRDLFELACFHRGTPPTVCTKTDRGGQYRAAIFADALNGRTEHVKIPPGCPWFNGEVERGNRDLKAVLYGLIARAPRPAAGQELASLLQLCNQARTILNEGVSRPSLGNVTPHEVAGGIDELVREGNRAFIRQQREDRKLRLADQHDVPWRQGLKKLLQVAERSTAELLRFLRLGRHDYAFLSK